MQYGDLPKDLGYMNIEVEEMCFYQYLPIKLKGDSKILYEERLKPLDSFIGKISCEFVAEYGLNNYMDSYIYLTVKNMYQLPNQSYNRGGWHSDGFLTEDINYIWSDKFPTLFNNSKFNLTLDDSTSLNEMEEQALEENNVTFNNGHILRLNKYNIHKVGEINEISKRLFIKVSFSKDKYNLKGNSINHLLDYKWIMVDRKQERNIPQSK